MTWDANERGWAKESRHHLLWEQKTDKNINTAFKNCVRASAMQSGHISYGTQPNHITHTHTHQINKHKLGKCFQNKLLKSYNNFQMSDWANEWVNNVFIGLFYFGTSLSALGAYTLHSAQWEKFETHSNDVLRLECLPFILFVHTNGS